MRSWGRTGEVGVKQKLWGGAFTKAPDERAWDFGQSLSSDAELLDAELSVSLAHAKMLGAVGIISADEAESLIDGLWGIDRRMRENRERGLDDFRSNAELFELFAPGAEDIHGAIEAMLREQVGDVADRLHAGRSRNDQIATVTRLWLRDRCFVIDNQIENLQSVLLDLAEKHKADPMPGFTHMQSAQPITLGFHLLAYFWMLQRDVVRFEQLKLNLNESPLGTAALAGTSLPIDRHMTAKELGFDRAMPNALDATSDRDFVGDALHACATLMQHLSRISQELVLWSGPMYNFVKLDEAFTTGSSIMPQKRNPDMAELIRGRSARVVGHWTAFMSMMKALPLGYNRDQQDDKPPLFDSFKLCMNSLYLCRGMLETAAFNTERMSAVAGEGFATATGIAEAMVKEGVPFRKAHEKTGQLVRKCEEDGTQLDLTVEDSIASRDGYGGPGPNAMAKQIEEARSALRRADEGRRSSTDG